MNPAAYTDAAVFANVDWDTFKHGVGIPTIDAQHKFLIAVLNRLCTKMRPSGNAESGFDFAASTVKGRRQAPITDRKFDDRLQKGRDKETITPEIEDLVTYCAKYITAEEHMLETYNYPDRAAHGLEHQLLVKEVQRAHSLLESYNMEESDVARLVTFLKTWIAEHIPKDRRFAPLLVDKESV